MSQQINKQILAQEFKIMDHELEAHFAALKPAINEDDADNEPKVANIVDEFKKMKANLTITKLRQAKQAQSPWAGKLNKGNII